jgi:hypothetical protein
MKTLVTATAALLLTAGAAAAAQPLSETQLDSVTAGWVPFNATASAHASGLVGPFQVVDTHTYTLAQVQQAYWTGNPYVYQSYSVSASATITGPL